MYFLNASVVQSLADLLQPSLIIPQVPYETLCYVVGAVNYGGRVTDYMDQVPAHEQNTHTIRLSLQMVVL